MDWEKVKGFCRRQTQRFEATYRHKPATKDDSLDALVHSATQYRTVADTLSKRLQRLEAVSGEMMALLAGIDADLRTLGNPGLDDVAKKFEMCSHDAGSKQQALGAACQDLGKKLQDYVQESALMTRLVEARATTMLEYDFFRNKLVDLRASPPSDPSRIPRNEQRLDDWRRRYESDSARLQQQAHAIATNGERVIGTASQCTGQHVAQLFNSASKSWQAVFGSSAAYDARGIPPPPPLAAQSVAPTGGPQYGQPAPPPAPHSDPPAQTYAHPPPQQPPQPAYAPPSAHPPPQAPAAAPPQPQYTQHPTQGGPPSQPPPSTSYAPAPSLPQNEFTDAPAQAPKRVARDMDDPFRM